MDSLTQLTLGAAVTVAAMGRRTAPWKAALWGAAAGTLPDLDALIDFGDAVRNMTLHRADSHALFWLTLAAPALAALPWAVHRRHHPGATFRRWWLAIWLALFTHPLLDWFTVYGTQLLRPFDTTAYGLGSLFIIDPAYTLPLLAGVVAVACGARLRWNGIGIAWSCAYLVWSAAVQAVVTERAQASLAAQGIRAERVLVTPSPFSTVLWRIVAIDGERFHEGFHSLLDAPGPIRFDAFPRGASLAPALAGHEPFEAIARFSDGFWKLSTDAQGRVIVTDLRMGQEPGFVFAFPIARAEGGRIVPVPASINVGGRGPDIDAALRWLGRRILGEPLPPPR